MKEMNLFGRDTERYKVDTDNYNGMFEVNILCNDIIYFAEYNNNAVYTIREEVRDNNTPILNTTLCSIEALNSVRDNNSMDELITGILTTYFLYKCAPRRESNCNELMTMLKTVPEIRELLNEFVDDWC